MTRFGLWLNGQECPALGANYFESIDPASGHCWCEVASGTGADVERAVASSQRAFLSPQWRRADPSWRRNLLQDMAQCIRENTDTLAEVECRDSGKLLRECRLHVAAAAEWLEYFAGMTDKFCGDTIPSDYGILNYTIPQPYGVVGAIVPGNSPLLLTAWKLAPALAAGNTLVVKPSEYTSASLITLLRLLGDRLPAGVVNVVTGMGIEVGKAIIEHPGIRKVAFTGGEVGGKAVAEGAGRRLAPVLLELGGKSANIIFDDAVYDKALAGIMAGVFAASGQTCMAGSRVLVQKGIYQRILTDLCARTGTIRVGHPAVADTQVGPLGNAAQLARVHALVSSAVKDGAIVRAGGNPLKLDAYPDGYYYSPTIITDVPVGADILKKEIFGPVMTVIPFDTEEDALSLANDSEFGLVAGVWTSNVFRTHRLAQALNAGTIFVNLYRKVAPQSPFGGQMQSGYGRENGFEVMREYTQVKSVLMDIDESRVQDPFVMRVGNAG